LSSTPNISVSRQKIKRGGPEQKKKETGENKRTKKTESFQAAKGGGTYNRPTPVKRKFQSGKKKKRAHQPPAATKKGEKKGLHVQASGFPDGKKGSPTPTP